MWSRFFFLIIAAFFVLMNVLLWRAEIANRNKPGPPVPVANVWHRIITAPNSSTLEVQHKGEKIGLLHWVPGVAEAASKGNHVAAQPPSRSAPAPPRSRCA